MKENRSFTLIELLIVIVIIAVLAAAITPVYRNFVWQARFSEILSTTEYIRKAVETYHVYNGSNPVVGGFDSRCDWEVGNGNYLTMFGCNPLNNKVSQILDIQVSPTSYYIYYIQFPQGGSKQCLIWIREPPGLIENHAWIYHRLEDRTWRWEKTNGYPTSYTRENFKPPF